MAKRARRPRNRNRVHAPADKPTPRPSAPATAIAAPVAPPEPERAAGRPGGVLARQRSAARDRAALVDLLVAVAAVIFVVVALRPALLFANTTPTGGDLGGHVWGPAFVRAHLFDRGLLAGWSNAWFGGFPAFRFYMPVPALGAVALGLIFHYGVALKLMVALPLVALPLIAWRWGVAARLPHPGPAMCALASLLFLFDSSNLKYGGSIASTVIGEYGNALALVLGLWCLARFADDIERSRRGVAAGILGGLAACCHPVGLLFVVVGLAVSAGAMAILGRDGYATAVHFGRTLALTVLLSAFWYVPFIALRLYTNDLNFERVTGLRALLFPLPLVVDLLLGILFVVGVLDAVTSRRPAVLALAATGVLFAFAALVAPRGVLWNARLAPPWQLAFVLVAGSGTIVIFDWARDSWPRARAWTGIALPIASAVLLFAALAWDMGTLPGTTKKTKVIDGQSVTTSVRWLIGPAHTPSSVPLVVKTAFSGYERQPNWPEYQDLISTMERLSHKYGCGRLMPEFDPSGRYGSVYADELLPYWTHTCISTVPGLYADSSPTSAIGFITESTVSETFSSYEPGLPYEPLNLERGVNDMRDLGARYYLAVSKAAIAQASTTAGLHKVATVGTSVIYVVDDAPLVKPLTIEPIVGNGVGSREAWEKIATQWWGEAQENAPRIAASGPDSWQRITDAQTQPALRNEPKVDVTGISVSDESIHFHVSRTGVPVLIRVSYFPWWGAQGAQGPYRVTPNWMVVVPTSADVTLTQHTQGVEWLGLFLTVVGVLLAIGLAAWLVVTRSRADKHPV